MEKARKSVRIQGKAVKKAGRAVKKAGKAVGKAVGRQWNRQSKSKERQ